MEIKLIANANNCTIAQRANEMTPAEIISVITVLMNLPFNSDLLKPAASL